MNSPPKLAVVITTYNSERFIYRTLYSAFNQSKPFDEIIVVDHASTDNTLSIIDEFISDHPQPGLFKQFQVDRNFGGPAWPRNLGIKYSQSDYICFLDADDMCAYNRSSTIQDFLYSEPDIIFHSFINFYDLCQSPHTVKLISSSHSSHVLDYNLKNCDLMNDLFYKGMATCTGSYVIAKRLFNDNLFLENRDVVGAEDAILLLDILTSQSVRAIYIGKPLFYYYIGSLAATDSPKPLRSSLTSPKNTIRNVNYMLNNYSSYAKFIRYRLLVSRHYSYLKLFLFRKLFLDLVFMHPLEFFSYIRYVLFLIFRPSFSTRLLKSKFTHFEALFTSSST